MIKWTKKRMSWFKYLSKVTILFLCHVTQIVAKQTHTVDFYLFEVKYYLIQKKSKFNTIILKVIDLCNSVILFFIYRINHVMSYINIRKYWARQIKRK